MNRSERKASPRTLLSLLGAISAGETASGVSNRITLGPESFQTSLGIDTVRVWYFRSRSIHSPTFRRLMWISILCLATFRWPPRPTTSGSIKTGFLGRGTSRTRDARFPQTPGKVVLQITPSHFLILFGISLAAELDLGSPAIRRGESFPGKSKRPRGTTMAEIPELGGGVVVGNRKYANLRRSGIIKQHGGELKVETRR